MTGGRDDWAVWLHRHGSALVLLARQWVATHADAEDVVQNALVRFWRSRQRAEDPAAYLFSCVRSSALDWQRGRQRRLKREEAAAVPEAEPVFVAPLEHDERRAMIEIALGQLPQEQREVLVMKIWGELTFPQIAVAMAIPESTAASRYRYALGKLRDQLAQEPIR